MGIQYDIGSRLKGEASIDPIVITAGTTADGTEINGNSADRLDLGNSHAFSALGYVQYEGTLAAGKTATIAANAQDSPSTTAWTDYGTAASTTIGSASSTAAQNIRGVLQVPLNLQGAERYLRVQATPTLSATGTDTLGLSAGFMFGGFDQIPYSTS